MPQTGYEDGTTAVKQAENLNKIVVEAAAKLPGAAESYIRTQLNRVVEDFFRKSTAWRVFTDPVTVTPTDLPIALNPYSGTARVINVLAVSIAGYPLSPLGIDSRVLIRAANTATRPAGYYTNPFDTVYFSPTVTADVEDVVFTLALKPIPETDVEDWVLDQFYEFLIAGLYSRMFSEKEKPYTDRTYAEQYGRRYFAGIAEAKALAEKNFTAGPSPWAFPRFAG